MENYIYIWRESTFSVQTFCNMVKDGKINNSELAHLPKFTNTDSGHIIVGNKMYRMYTNCVCKDSSDNIINIICCVEFD